jgi:hypothetical protein
MTAAAFAASAAAAAKAATSAATFVEASWATPPPPAAAIIRLALLAASPLRAVEGFELEVSMRPICSLRSSRLTDSSASSSFSRRLVTEDSSCETRTEEFEESVKHPNCNTYLHNVFRGVYALTELVLDLSVNSEESGNKGERGGSWRRVSNLIEECCCWAWRWVLV